MFFSLVSPDDLLTFFFSTGTFVCLFGSPVIERKSTDLFNNRSVKGTVFYVSLTYRLSWQTAAVRRKNRSPKKGHAEHTRNVATSRSGVHTQKQSRTVIDNDNSIW